MRNPGGRPGKSRHLGWSSVIETEHRDAGADASPVAFKRGWPNPPVK